MMHLIYGPIDQRERQLWTYFSSYKVTARRTVLLMAIFLHSYKFCYNTPGATTLFSTTAET